MRTLQLHDKDTIEHAMRHNTYLHLYEIGDLDDFFWPYTTWHALEEDGEIAEVALLYCGSPLPVLLGLSDKPEQMAELIRRIRHLLPVSLYAHLSDGVLEALSDRYVPEHHGPHVKMGLTRPERLEGIDTQDVTRFTPDDLAELSRFYDESFPGNWFEPRMLETGYAYGIRRDGRIVSAAGIHVYSPRYQVAGVGNVVTHQDYRRQGLATQVCAKLCTELLKTVTHVALNVRADNAPAQACYAGIGFDRMAGYHELALAYHPVSST